MVKIAAPSPMVTAIASPPTSVSPHDRRSMRRPSLVSSQNVSSHGRPRAARAASRSCAVPPRSSLASRRASSGLMPRRTLSSSAIARCASSSWSNSASPWQDEKPRIRRRAYGTAHACVSPSPSPDSRQALSDSRQAPIRRTTQTPSPPFPPLPPPPPPLSPPPPLPLSTVRHVLPEASRATRRASTVACGSPSARGSSGPSPGRPGRPSVPTRAGRR